MNKARTKVRRSTPQLSNLTIRSSKTVFVLNLPDYIHSAKDVKRVLSVFGAVSEAFIISSSPELSLNSTWKDRSSTLSRFAIVEFSKLEEASRAVMHKPSDDRPYVIRYADDEVEDLDFVSPQSKSGRRQLDNTQVMSENSMVVPRSRRRSFQLDCLKPKMSPTRESVLQDRNQGDEERCTNWLRKKLMSERRVVVIRQPRGPDGTMGFHEGRSKAKLPH